MAAFVALSVSFTSCDALNDATTKEVEVEAPAITFSIGGPEAAMAAQKVSANGKVEVVWLDTLINLKSELETELAKEGLTVAQVKTLLVTSSQFDLFTETWGYKFSSFNLGSPILYIDGIEVGRTDPWLMDENIKLIKVTYTAPFDIFNKLSSGKMQVKIVSDKPVPSERVKLNLINAYKASIGLLR